MKDVDSTLAALGIVNNPSGRPFGRVGPNPWVDNGVRDRQDSSPLGDLSNGGRHQSERRTKPTKLEERAAKSYYFIGNDPARWHNKVPNYGRVRYHSVYPGIDLVYYGNQQQLEYDLLLAPGADPSCIQLIFREARQLRLNPESGDVEIVEPGGDVCLHKPVVYQMAKGQKRESIEGSYVLATGNRVRLVLGSYDSTRPMVIDPILVYSTYLGGSSGMDQGNGIAVDGRGNAYVTGIA